MINVCKHQKGNVLLVILLVNSLLIMLLLCLYKLDLMNQKLLQSYFLKRQTENRIWSFMKYKLPQVNFSACFDESKKQDCSFELNGFFYRIQTVDNIIIPINKSIPALVKVFKKVTLSEEFSPNEVLWELIYYQECKLEQDRLFNKGCLKAKLISVRGVRE